MKYLTTMACTSTQTYQPVRSDKRPPCKEFCTLHPSWKSWQPKLRHLDSLYVTS